MTNEEAIQILKPFRDCMVDQHGCPISDAVPALDLAIAALVRGRWIPCEEILPTLASTVIVAGKMKYRFEAEYTTFVDVAIYTLEECFETFNDWYEGQDEFCITHWMPLPEPPKEDKPE